jgi:hypothetical protein
MEETSGTDVDYEYISLNSCPLAMVRKQANDERRSTHNDHLSTPKVMTDKLKKVVWNGNWTRSKRSTGNRQRAAIYAAWKTTCVSRQYYDAETGCTIRTYNPNTGRYRNRPDWLGEGKHIPM